YGTGGRQLVTYTTWVNSNPQNAMHYFNGQRVGQWTDRIGSKRQEGGTTSHYYPYGEEVVPTSNDEYKFAQTLRDSDSGLDYAMTRYYANTLGRFLTADPKASSAQPGGPQSWNRYSYTKGDPVNQSDPYGLDPEGGYCSAYPSDPGCSALPTGIGGNSD